MEGKFVKNSVIVIVGRYSGGTLEIVLEGNYPVNLIEIVPENLPSILNVIS